MATLPDTIDTIFYREDTGTVDYTILGETNKVYSVKIKWVNDPLIFEEIPAKIPLVSTIVIDKEDTINPIKQSLNRDCFSACVAMLTNNPLEAIPVRPPRVLALKLFSGNAKSLLHPDDYKYWNNFLRTSMNAFLQDYSSAPDKPCITTLWGKADTSHAVIKLPAGDYIDPSTGKKISPSYYPGYEEVWWATIERYESDSTDR